MPVHKTGVPDNILLKITGNCGKIRAYNKIFPGGRSFMGIYKRALPIGICIAATLFFSLHAARLVNVDFMDRLEALSYDLRLNLTLPHSHNSKIVIVDIDEKSLSEEGRWPWSRNKLALLVANLLRHNAAVIGLDVVFAEKDESSGLKTLEQLGKKELHGDEAFQNNLRRIRDRMDYDNVFARLIKGKPVVLGYYFTHYADKSRERVSGQLPPTVFPSGAFEGMNIPFVKMTGYGANLPKLQDNAMSAGHFNQLPDADGVVRRIPMIIEYNGSYYESLSLAVVRALFGSPSLKPGLVSSGGGGSAYKRIEWLQTSDLRIPVDERITSLIPYAGGQGSFPYISAADVLRDSIKTDVLEGAIVLVGTTSPGLMDLRSTPVQAVYPGVEVQANMIAGILDQNIRKKPAYTMGAELLALLSTGLLLSFLLPYLSPLKATLVGFLAAACVIAINMWAWKNNLVLPLASSVINISFIFILNMSYGFFIETGAKRRIKAMFSSYVTERIVNELIKNPDMAKLGGERREITILFSDVKGFTSFSEKHTPEEVVSILNEYLGAMTGVVFKWEGTLDKFIGDAILVFWSAPMHQENHAELAVKCALDMVGTLGQLRQKWLSEGKASLDCGIGINTGEVIVGNIGAEGKKMDYTIIGDHVNLSSRVESLTRKYNVDILITEFTLQKIREKIESKSLAHVSVKGIEKVVVKGKEKPVEIYELTSLEGGKDSVITSPVEKTVVVLKDK